MVFKSDTALITLAKINSRWRLGNVVYGGLYRKKYDADLEKAVQYYSSCAKKRRF